MSAPPPRLHFPELDGLRGFAALVVVTTHCWFYRGDEGVWILLDRVRDNGWIAMDTFFALSGYLITGILVDSVGRERYWSTFFVRRALRVFPVYYLVMVLLFGVARPLVTAAGFGLQEPVAPAWSHFLYVANFYIADAQRFGFVPAEISWSLCIEEQFYTVWPFLVALLPRRAFVAFLIALCALSPLVRLIVFDATGGALVPVYVLTWTRMDAVAWGALAALAVRHAGDRERWLPTVHRLAAVAWLAVAVVVACNGFDRQHTVVVAVGYSLTPLATALGIVSMRYGGARFAVRTLSWRPLREVGKLSYAMYLSHVTILTLVNRLPWTRAVFDGYQSNAWISLAHLTFVAATSLAVAALSWRFFEGPILAAKDRLAPYPHSPPDAAAPRTAP